MESLNVEQLEEMMAYAEDPKKAGQILSLTAPYMNYIDEFKKLKDKCGIGCHCHYTGALPSELISRHFRIWFSTIPKLVFGFSENGFRIFQS